MHSIISSSISSTISSAISSTISSTTSSIISTFLPPELGASSGHAGKNRTVVLILNLSGVSGDVDTVPSNGYG